MLAEPLDLPVVDPPTVGVMNDLVGAHRPLAFSLGGEAVSLRLVAPQRATGPAAALQFGDQRAWLHLADWNAIPSVRALLDGQGLDQLPSSIQPIVLSAAFEPDLTRLERLVGSHCRLEEVKPIESIPKDLLSVGLELALPAGTVAGTLAADFHVLTLLRDRLMQVAPVALHPRTSLRVHAGVEIGLTQLTIDELESLAAGDVVLLEVASPRDNPTALVRLAPQATWKVRLGDGRLELLEPVELRHWSDELAGGPTITLLMEQGGVELSVAEAAQLRPGDSVEWHDSYKVVVRAGRQELGYGDLVEIGGRKGVRLQQWRVVPTHGAAARG